jgi:hypothetical protein
MPTKFHFDKRILRRLPFLRPPLEVLDLGDHLRITSQVIVKQPVRFGDALGMRTKAVRDAAELTIAIQAHIPQVKSPLTPDTGLEMFAP